MTRHLALAALLLTAAAPALGQSPMEADWRPEFRTLDVLEVRADVDAARDLREVRVRLALRGVVLRPTLRLPLRGSGIDSIRVHREQPGDWALPDSTLHMLSPDSTASADSSGVGSAGPEGRHWLAYANADSLWIQSPAAVGDTVQVDLLYSLRLGAGLARTGPGCCTWTDHGRGESWLPLPAWHDDHFLADVRIHHPGNRLAGSETTGFSTFAPAQPVFADQLPIVLGDFATEVGHWVTLWYGSGDPSALLLRLDAAADAMDLPPTHIAFVDLQGSPPLHGPGLVVADQALLMDPEAAALAPLDFEAARLVAGQVVPSVRPWTDIWVEAAATCWLAASSLADADDRFAAWVTLQDRYLAEARRYQRPLTWDAWVRPSDLLDDHACARGAWALRYVAARTDESVVKQALLSPAIDSDALLRALDRHSTGSLADWFDAAVYAAGHPEVALTADFSATASELVIRVDQRIESELGSIYQPFLLEVGVESLEGAQAGGIQFLSPSAEIAVPLTIPPNSVHMDPEGQVLMVSSGPDDAGWWAAGLRSPSPWNRMRAIDQVSGFYGDAAAGFAVRQALRDEPLASLRARLIRHAGPVFGAELRPALLERLRDSDPQVRIAALDVLGGLGQNSAAERAILDLAARDSTDGVLAACVRALHAMDSDQAVAVARSALVTPSHDEVVRLAGFTVLAARGRGDLVRAAFLEQSSPAASTASIRAALAGAVSLERDQTIRRRMLGLLAHERPAVRRAAISAAFPVLAAEDARSVERLARDEVEPTLAASLLRLVGQLQDRR